MTHGVDLLGLPLAARLAIGETAVVEVTGLRNPCVQMNQLQSGLMPAVIERKPGGKVVRKAGVMGIVTAGGIVKPGDAIRVELPPQPWTALAPV